MSIKTDAKHVKQQALEQLTLLRDEAKLQLHLLSLDAKQRWHELEREFAALEQQAQRDGVQAAEALKDGAQKLAHGLRALIDSQAVQSAGLLASARSLMSDHVRSCSPDDSLSHAAQLMWDTDCGALPVLRDDKVVGVITDRDICMATFTQGKPPSELRVAGAMSGGAFRCGPDDSLGEILATMGKQRVRRLPVVDADDRLLGIVTLADIARLAQVGTNAGVQSAMLDALASICGPSPVQLASAAE